MSWEDNFTRGYHVESLNYYYSKEHALIGIGALSSLKIQNIGKHGENLSFAVLSMNRSSLTIKLMNSVAEFMPDFLGEFVIGDNGSTHDEKEILRRAMKRMPYKCRMVEFDKNYGVAEGRNRLFTEIKTDWILSADNDLFFIGNPLSKIQQDIAQIGCRFLALPLIDHTTGGTGIYGGHLYVEHSAGQISIGGSTALIAPKLEPNVEAPPSLGTFLPGGVSVINKDTFFRCGGFDKEMFVGFEDTEFSVRLFQEGYKIGNCGVACIVHDHPKPTKVIDTGYEKQRFSKDFLKESASYFEKKHYFKVWNPMVENWLEGRLNDLLGTSSNSANKMRTKFKIALVIDAPNWALDHIADQVIANLSQHYDFRRIYLSAVDNLTDVLLLAEDCQLVHFLWRPLASSYYSDYTQSKISSLGMSSNDFMERFVAHKTISVGVYDHLMLEGAESHFTQELFTDTKSIVNSYTVSSNKLREVYNSDPQIVMKPSAVMQDGVDLGLFQPVNLQRFRHLENRQIRIGWVGNSKWAVGDLKGINTIIRPSIDVLQRKGYNIELVTTDRQDKLIPHDEMPSYYSQLDLYICASSCEGTPNPVLEAMACGIPVISTDVGLVPECFGNLQKEYILEERSIHCLVRKLQDLMDNPDRFAKLSAENLDSIKAWDWSIMVNNFKEYFDTCLIK